MSSDEKQVPPSLAALLRVAMLRTTPQPEEKKEAAFRIGGIYRSKGGELYSLHPATVSHWGPGCALAVNVERHLNAGHRRLIDGSECDADMAGYYRDLIPGEVDINGEPVSFFFRDPLKVSAKTAQALEKLDRGYAAQAAQKAEPKRAALTWADSKAADPFAGFSVTSSAQLQPRPASPFASPDLAHSSHQVAPMFGSAHLKPKA